MEKSWFSLAATECCLSKTVTCGALRNNDPLTGTLLAHAVMCGNKYPFVMSDPASVSTAIHCSTALIGHVAKLTSSHGIVIKRSCTISCSLYPLEVEHESTAVWQP